MITYTISFKTRYEVTNKPSGVHPTHKIKFDNFKEE